MHWVSGINKQPREQDHDWGRRSITCTGEECALPCSKKTTIGWTTFEGLHYDLGRGHERRTWNPGIIYHQPGRNWNIVFQHFELLDDRHAKRALQRKVWDPGLAHRDILKQHLEDKEEHLVVPCSAEEIVKFPTQPEKIGEDGGHLEEFQDVLTGDEVDITGPLITVEDEPLMMLGSDPNTIKEDFSNDLDGQHSADKNLYKCSVETRTGSGSKKNMGSWNYSRGHSKATP
ncbi:hypothetical protein Tco_0031651 [Tanacetum coccineum]